MRLCCTALCQIAFRLYHANSHNANEWSKLIESIYPKSNSYFLMDKAYEYDKTLALVEAHDFIPVVFPAKKS